MGGGTRLCQRGTSVSGCLRCNVLHFSMSIACCELRVFERWQAQLSPQDSMRDEKVRAKNENVRGKALGRGVWVR